jgi:hypothetical protein
MMSGTSPRLQYCACLFFFLKIKYYVRYSKCLDKEMKVVASFRDLIVGECVGSRCYIVKYIRSDLIEMFMRADRSVMISYP